MNIQTRIFGSYDDCLWQKLTFRLWKLNCRNWDLAKSIRKASLAITSYLGSAILIKFRKRVWRYTRLSLAKSPLAKVQSFVNFTKIQQDLEDLYEDDRNKAEHLLYKKMKMDITGDLPPYSYLFIIKAGPQHLTSQIQFYPIIQQWASNRAVFYPNSRHCSDSMCSTV